VGASSAVAIELGVSSIAIRFEAKIITYSPASF
jgi:hypothetical protein